MYKLSRIQKEGEKEKKKGFDILIALVNFCKAYGIIMYIEYMETRTPNIVRFHFEKNYPVPMGLEHLVSIDEFNLIDNKLIFDNIISRLIEEFELNT